MADDFFDDGNDPFDQLVKQFFGHAPGKSKPRMQRKVDSQEDLSSGEVIENDDIVYLIFEIPGFSDQEIKISVKDNILEIKAEKKSKEDIQ